MKVKNVLISYMKPKNDLQAESIMIVKSVLKSKGIRFISRERSRLKEVDTLGADLILSVGGDGTFLRTSYSIKSKIPVLGINMDPRNKEGFLLKSNYNNFGRDLDKILSGDFKLVKLNRLQGKLNGKLISHFALNEFYVGFQKAYHTARYEFTIDGKTEFQKSSGLLIGSAAGSNGWIKSAGGRILSLDSDKFQMIVREPYCSRITQCKIQKKVFNSSEKIKIKSEMNNGIVVIDSLPYEYPFHKGDIFEVSMSKKPISYVVFKAG